MPTKIPFGINLDYQDEQLIRRKFMNKIVVFFLLIILASSVQACDMKDIAIAYFFPFDAQTYVPIKKDEIETNGAKVVIKIPFFKELIVSAQNKNISTFFENIRMKVTFNEKSYYINQEGFIELDEIVIGKLDEKAIDSLNLGNGLYEWKTCRPFKEVLAETYKKITGH